MIQPHKSVFVSQLELLVALRRTVVMEFVSMEHSVLCLMESVVEMLAIPVIFLVIVVQELPAM